VQSDEIRTRFLDFFRERGHIVVPSASLVSPDPALLLTVAGMVPFMPYFLGQEPPPYPRAASVQKCVRTLDIDEVGKTTRHASFFQMAGNFSFGDYFKEQAIPHAWELLTRPLTDGGFGLAESRLWVTVYETDDEAAEIWRKAVGVPADRIQRMGMKENFWSTGAPGPCGPCSEIFYDRGPEHGRDGGPAVDDERFREVWNLVFMQYERGPGTGKGDYEILRELPKKNIDTGMGLERLAAILQGVDSTYDIDTSRAILDGASVLTGVEYGAAHDSDVRLRVVADHVRASVMLINDGIRPGNEGRDYILRRLLRRATRSMRLLGAPDPTMGELVDATVEAMGPQYPELRADAERIKGVAVAEEAAFLQTLTKGVSLFESAVPVAKETGVLAAEVAFRLHDTNGFPIDLTLEMAAEQGLEVDQEGFRALMAEQRNRAKADAADKRGGLDVSVWRGILDAGGPTDWLAYQTLTLTASVRALLREGEATPVLTQDQVGHVVLDRTPFYAESGGQDSDAGTLTWDGGSAEVLDVQRPVKGLVVHQVRVVQGELALDRELQATVDERWRRDACQAHSGTHVVHAALRQVLGPDAVQAGSYNRPGYLRLDFSWKGALSTEQRSEVERVSNLAVRDDLPVSARWMTLPEAQEFGALALFGETYGEKVRVIEIGGPWSRELCGGTHVRSSAQIGPVVLTTESSVGAGSRRVEALVGVEAYGYLARERDLVAQLTDLLKTPQDGIALRVSELVSRLKETERQLAQVRAGKVLEQAGQFAADARDVFGVAFAGIHAPDGTPADLVRALALDVRGRLAADRPGVVVVMAGGERVTMVAAVNDAGRARGLSANDLLREAAPAVEGKGGGKDDVAQGGGTHPAGIDEGLTRAEHLVGRVATS
jgi:alanyl-tRNA synthetase